MGREEGTWCLPTAEVAVCASGFQQESWRGMRSMGGPGKG